jgi:hypothetical protein
MTGNTHKVEHYDEVDNTTICKSCWKHGHGLHNCPTPDKPRCGICAGDHSTNEHKCKVRACQSSKGRRCYTHEILQCANCGGDHMVWNKKQCKVRQLALTDHRKTLHTEDPLDPFPKNPPKRRRNRQPNSFTRPPEEI